MRMCKQKNKSNLEVRVQRRGLHVQLSAAAMAAVLFHILFSGVVLGIRLCFGAKKTMGKQRFFLRSLLAHLRIWRTGSIGVYTACQGMSGIGLYIRVNRGYFTGTGYGHLHGKSFPCTLLGLQQSEVSL